MNNLKNRVKDRPSVEEIAVVVVVVRLPAIALAALIWFLSSQSTLPQPKGILGSDKLQHFLAFGALAFFAGLWVSSARWKQRPLASFSLITLVVSAYGAIDELHQRYIPGRNSSLWDWLADTAGALLGTLVILFLATHIVHRRNP